MNRRVFVMISTPSFVGSEGPYFVIVAFPGYLHIYYFMYSTGERQNNSDKVVFSEKEKRNLPVSPWEQLLS